MKRKYKHPTNKGQKFISEGDAVILTVKSFAGADGIKFETYDEAAKHNKDGHFIGIENEEYENSFSHVIYCILQ